MLQVVLAMDEQVSNKNWVATWIYDLDGCYCYPIPISLTETEKLK